MEKMEALVHSIWSRWMKKLLSGCGSGDYPGDLVIPVSYVEEIARQMNTNYYELDHGEDKEHIDECRKIAEDICEVIGEEL